MGTGPLINLHTHTVYSDGDFLPDDIVRRAYQGGLTHIAITDHFETVKVPSPLKAEHFERYMNNLDALKEMYKGKIKVLAGVEIDTNPTRCDLESLPVDLINRLDVVLFEYASDPMNGGCQLEGLEDFRKQLTRPICGLCHWDMDRIFPHRDPNELANTLNVMDLFVEISTSPFYTRDGLPYFQHAERFYRSFPGKVKVSIGTDTHRRIDEVVNLKVGQEFVRRIGLEKDVIIQ
ncbi:MAG TPA: PHP domain-containing protein [Methanomassiliicoccales archaeon]|jgi:histidinol phosphatase-like PHP family hydrolase